MKPGVASRSSRCNEKEVVAGEEGHGSDPCFPSAEVGHIRGSI